MCFVEAELLVLFRLFLTENTLLLDVNVCALIFPISELETESARILHNANMDKRTIPIVFDSDGVMKMKTLNMDSVLQTFFVRKYKCFECQRLYCSDCRSWKSCWDLKYSDWLTSTNRHQNDLGIVLRWCIRSACPIMWRKPKARFCYLLSSSSTVDVAPSQPLYENMCINLMGPAHPESNQFDR